MMTEEIGFKDMMDAFERFLDRLEARIEALEADRAAPDWPATMSDAADADVVEEIGIDPTPIAPKPKRKGRPQGSKNKPKVAVSAPSTDVEWREDLTPVTPEPTLDVVAAVLSWATSTPNGVVLAQKALRERGWASVRAIPNGEGEAFMARLAALAEEAL